MIHNHFKDLMEIQINILQLNNGKHGKLHYVNNELIDVKK